MVGKKKIMFVCNANCNRSPTFERRVAELMPEWEVRSAGIYAGYPYQVSKETLEWADEIYVMTLDMFKFLEERYPTVLFGGRKPKRVEIIGISDDYDPHEPRLVELVDYWLARKKRRLTE